MEIGKPRRVHRVEPLKVPVPKRTSPAPEPKKTPAAPRKAEKQ
jgi:hypothetical protein